MTISQTALSDFHFVGGITCPSKDGQAATVLYNHFNHAGGQKEHFQAINEVVVKMEKPPGIKAV